MDSLHKKVLCNKTSAIMLRISNPSVLAAFLSRIFTSSDKEEIAARQTNNGPTVATQALIHLLEKRGPNAFQGFIDALKDDAFKHNDLAEELENEERRLSGQDMRRSQSLPTDSEEPMEEQFSRRGLSPPPHSAPASSSDSEMYKFSPVPQSPVYNHAHELPEIGRESNYQEQSSPPVITLGTLVKDIPYSLRAKIEKMMNVPDARNHDWRGVAGAMGMSTEDVRQLEGEAKGRMTGLFEIMIQTKKSVKDLLELMKNTDVQRLDVVDEIRRGCKLPAQDVMETDSAETQVSDSKKVAYSQESSKSPTNLKPLPPNPIQESQGAKDTNSKVTTCSPVQEEHGDSKGRGQAELDTKPDARTPTQVEDDDDLKQSHQLPCQEENNVAEDVFYNAEDNEVKKYALLISCCGNSSKEKKHDTELRKLRDVLEDAGYEVICKRQCKVADLLHTVRSYLRQCKDSGKIMSFVYLVGATVHINSENYLLPADLKIPPSRADLMHSSLNINWLVAQLSKNYMQAVIIDGAHENGLVSDNLNGVLQGLAAMKPPANAVIAFPCHPGTIRKDQERLDYITSVVKYMKEENMLLEDLFANVRGDLSQTQPAISSLPLEFSLTSFLIPLCFNPAAEDSKGLPIPSGSDDFSAAIIISNFNYGGLNIKSDECVTDLRMALVKAGWHCEEISDKSSKGIRDDLREALDRFSDKGTVMLYFMGCTKVIMDYNYFFGKDFSLESEEPLRSSVSLQWSLDLMCEKLRGRKVLIVDDLNSCETELAPMISPLNVMISLPKGGDSRPCSGDASFTSKFAQLLETKSSQLSLEEMVKKAASFDRHRLSSNLLHSN
ncbi:uncharacterized protein [Montipora capricornis]|uniref:uncharacterized protein n=1 Tax=Montipora capricornis TaxID=246305 RepID=UPI0035F1ADD4